jgi:hypothetical protein
VNEKIILTMEVGAYGTMIKRGSKTIAQCEERLVLGIKQQKAVEELVSKSFVVGGKENLRTVKRAVAKL